MKRHKSTVLPTLLVLFLTGATAQAQGVSPNVLEEIQQILQGTRGAAPQGLDQLNFFQAPGQRSGGGRGGQLTIPPVVRLNSWTGGASWTGGGAWWTNAAVIQRLGLTDDQKARLERAFENHRQTLVTSTGLLEKEETQLARLLEAETIDRSAVFTQIDRVTQARGEVERANSAMTLEMREQLTRAQWMQLQSPVQRVRVGGNVVAANLISQVDPVYPESARQAGTQGVGG